MAATQLARASKFIGTDVCQGAGKGHALASLGPLPGIGARTQAVVSRATDFMGPPAQSTIASEVEHLLTIGLSGLEISTRILTVISEVIIRASRHLVIDGDKNPED